MKVGIDLSSLPYGRGVSRYTSNLFIALTQLNDLQLYTYASSKRNFNKLKKDLTYLSSQLTQEQKQFFQQNQVIQKIPPKLNHLFWHYLHLNPIKKLLPDIEVFHSWDYLQPPDQNLPLVSTVHDLAILKFPDTAHPQILTYHRESWNILKKRKAHIIAVSKQTQTDLIDLLNFPEDRVHLVYEALPQDSILSEKELIEQNFSLIRQKFSLPNDYFLFVGTREPRKNLERLIQAWWPLREKIALVLVGANGWNEPKFKHRQLIILPRVDDFDLGLLYKQATALVYPSLDEGFGLPILEAFNYKIPVLTSLGTATQEIAGKAGILVDPYQIESIRKGLEKILNFNTLEKEKLKEKMTKQLTLFSWQKAAQQTKAVYQIAWEDFHA